MDNIKNFLGHVMTTTPSASTITGPDSAKQVATTAIGGDRTEDPKYLQLQKVTAVGGSGGGGVGGMVRTRTESEPGVGNVGGSGGGGVGGMVRTRTDSESSVASDISGVSMSSTDSAGGRQIKRADSEPYFWIMWHS